MANVKSACRTKIHICCRVGSFRPQITCCVTTSSILEGKISRLDIHLLFRLFVKLASTGDLNKNQVGKFLAATHWSHNRRNSKGSEPWSCTLLCYRFTGFSLGSNVWKVNGFLRRKKEPNLAIWKRNKRFSPIYGMVLLGPLSLCSSHSQSFLKNLSVASVLHSEKHTRSYKSYLNLASDSSAFAWRPDCVASDCSDALNSGFLGPVQASKGASQKGWSPVESRWFMLVGVCHQP